MVPCERPTRRTVSRCEPEMDRCTHVFEISSYSLHRGLDVSEHIESAAFAAGGHDWCIRFYPNGDGWEDVDGYEDSVSLYLELLSKAEVRALVDFRLVDPATGVSSSVHAAAGVFSSVQPTLGAGNLMEKSLLESKYLKEDRLVIECDVTVIMRTSFAKSEVMCDIQVPPSVLVDNLGTLLESEEGADVTLKVKDELFRAHKIVLAMQSPVFRAEFFGPMSDKGMKIVTIEDMQPAVFKALLLFIYKDTMPMMDDLDAGEREEMVKHLLVAADRYAMERMKVMCESILSKKLDVATVAATLVLADKHNCSQLKDACIEFINSSVRMGDVVASPGYAHLKRACPAVIMEIWEKSAKSRRMIKDTELILGKLKNF